MEVYVASSFTRRTEAASLARLLEEHGYEVVSLWHDIPQVGYVEGLDTWQLNESAMRDFDGVSCSKAVVCITGDTETRGGRHSEVGIAIAQGKRILLLGPREQVFHTHPLVTQHDNRTSVLATLATLRHPGIGKEGVELQEAQSVSYCGESLQV